MTRTVAKVNDNSIVRARLPLVTHMYCRGCLYDLSRTATPRCPECGMSFNPRNPAHTTMPTRNRIQWFTHRAKSWLKSRLPARIENRNIFCRECFTDLRQVPEDRCPTCGAWFDARDPGTFWRNNESVTRAWNRFRHVCVWRGVILATGLLIYAIICIWSEHTFLPGGGSRTYIGPLMELNGPPAIAMGIAWLGAALALHSKYFWGQVEPIWRFADLGVIAGVIAIALGWGYALVYAIDWTFG